MNSIREAQDMFLSRKFGVFHHFLYGNPSDDMRAMAAHSLDWNACVDNLDVNKLARQLRDIGAGYYCITIMQGSKHMLAPNATYDRIAGTHPGDACARRDVIADLAYALSAFDIDLFLYYTGDGPHLDPVIGKKFGFAEPRGHVTDSFVQKWADVLREYAVRYGNAVKGWWIDGCYRSFFAYDDRLLAMYYDACKAGNPYALVAMNDGVKTNFVKNYIHEDFICGEFNDFAQLPPQRFIDGAQTHILAPLGCGRDAGEWSRWCSKGAKLSAEYMTDYVKRANAIGMPVTIDAYIDHDGNWDDEQVRVLSAIGKHLR